MNDNERFQKAMADFESLCDIHDEASARRFLDILTLAWRTEARMIHDHSWH